MFRFTRISTLAGVASLGLLAGCSSAMMDDRMDSGAMSRPMSIADVQNMLAAWPEPSRMAAMEMMSKYGAPSGVTATTLSWANTGPWKWTKISRDPVWHNFPTPHPDVWEQAIDYRVPVDKFDDMARYDGSVVVERTKGEMSARCDKEGANFLAINLANDVATGRRSAEQARDYYSRAMKTFKETQVMDSYMQGLRFQPMGDARDPDQSTI